MSSYTPSYLRADIMPKSHQKYPQRQWDSNADPHGPRRVSMIQRRRERRRAPAFTESDEDHEETASKNSDTDHPSVVTYLDSGGRKEIKVTSKYLIEAITRFDEQKSIALESEYFSEIELFPILFYCINGVRDEILKLNDDEATQDLQKLNSILADIEPFWKRAREEGFDTGLVSHDMLWKLFRPGDLVLHEDKLGSLWQFSFIDVQYPAIIRPGGRKPRIPDPAIVNVWGLGWDSSEKTLTRTFTSFEIEGYSGQRPISSLIAFPIKYYSYQYIPEVKELLAHRGKHWWNAIKSRASCFDYDDIAGNPYDKIHSLEGRIERRYLKTGKPNRFKIRERVVIDDEAKALQYLDCTTTPSHTTESQFYRREKHKWDGISVTTSLTDQQARFCPAVIGCHALSTGNPYMVRVDKLMPIAWNIGAMDHLVLEQKKKDTLKGLVGQHYSRRKSESTGDLIKDKGKGLVVLLHGPPGVGKTLTAECVSEAIQRPLISLSIGDLVWEEKHLEERLKEEFDRAARWDAILLLDEADVVLEARSFEDVRRNGMVSVFLRQLEYYQGVLFLTSNRVSTMDIAFQSRIQIGISFKNMTPAIRSQIWQQLLALNGRDKIIGPQAVEDVKQKLGKFDLNGRQIRNVLNVADGLAFNQYGESGKLKYSHIREAVESAVEFQNMLEDAKSSMKNEQTVWAMYRGGDD